QLAEKDPLIKYEDVLSGMMERDKRDETREASPMRVPKDAEIIDNSNLTVEQTVEEMLKQIHA
ncbi:MAG: (d)CMP kinase, partial [Candidatus Daviesbacteria bacterium]|nr:(d)CMP kinase [Candidatus Daviesbacteria bacterium]